MFRSEVISIAEEIPKEKMEISEVVEIVVPKEEVKEEQSPLRLEVSAENNIISKVLPSDHIGSPKVEEPPKQDKRVTRAKIF